MDFHALVLTALPDILVNEIVDKVLRNDGVQFFRHVDHS
jgi:hypothetical protein